MATGTGVVNFGAVPGSDIATLVVTGQGDILSGSFVEAYLVPTSTADHSADEHLIDGPRVIAGAISAGVGFTVYALATDRPGSRLYGSFTIAWVWVLSYGHRTYRRINRVHAGDQRP